MVGKVRAEDSAQYSESFFVLQSNKKPSGLSQGSTIEVHVTFSTKRDGDS